MIWHILGAETKTGLLVPFILNLISLPLPLHFWCKYRRLCLCCKTISGRVTLLHDMVLWHGCTILPETQNLGTDLTLRWPWCWPCPWINWGHSWLGVGWMQWITGASPWGLWLSQPLFLVLSLCLLLVTARGAVFLSFPLLWPSAMTFLLSTGLQQWRQPAMDETSETVSQIESFLL